MRSDSRVVVLTGVGREGQVGEIVAEAFAREGASLILIDRLKEEAEARATALRRQGHDASAHVADLTDPAAVATLAERVRTAHGHADALINLAGGFAASGPVAESDIVVWQRMLAINLTSAYVATRAFLPLLRREHGGGAVVFVSSQVALPGRSVAGTSAYAVAKTGIICLMRAVAEEERNSGVRANAIAPASIRTAQNLATMGEATRYVARESVASAILFLCSDAARAVTGQVLELA